MDTKCLKVYLVQLLICFLFQEITSCDLAQNAKFVARQKYREFKNIELNTSRYEIVQSIHQMILELDSDSLDKGGYLCASMAYYYYVNSLKKMAKYLEKKGNDTLLSYLSYCIISSKIAMLNLQCCIISEGDICYSNLSNIKNLAHGLYTLEKLCKAESLKKVNSNVEEDNYKKEIELECNYTIANVKYSIGNSYYLLLNNNCCEQTGVISCKENFKREASGMYTDVQKIIKQIKVPSSKYGLFFRCNTQIGLNEIESFINQRILELQN